LRGEDMTGEQYMNNIGKVRREIRLLMEQIERDTILASGVKAIRYDLDKVQTSPSDRMPDIVATITITTDKLYKRIEELQQLEESARSLLLQLRAEHERVLVMRYFDEMSWENIAEKIGYNDKYIFELKDRALNELTQILQSSDSI